VERFVSRGGKIHLTGVISTDLSPNTHFSLTRLAQVRRSGRKINFMTRPGVRLIEFVVVETFKGDVVENSPL